MEKEKSKLELDDKVKLIEKLIDDEKEAIEQYNKAINKLTGQIKPCVLERLSHIYQEEVSHLATLEEIKCRVEKHGLGDPQADEIFGFLEY